MRAGEELSNLWLQLFQKNLELLVVSQWFKGRVSPQKLIIVESFLDGRLQQLERPRSVLASGLPAAGGAQAHVAESHRHAPAKAPDGIEPEESVLVFHGDNGLHLAGGLGVVSQANGSVRETHQTPVIAELISWEPGARLHGLAQKR
jgi:hypothetical protein